MSVIGFYKDEKKRTRPITTPHGSKIPAKLPTLMKDQKNNSDVKITVDRGLILEDPEYFGAIVRELDRIPPELLSDNDKKPFEKIHISTFYEPDYSSTVSSILVLNALSPDENFARFAIHQRVGAKVYDLIKKSPYKESELGIPNHYDKKKFSIIWAKYYTGSNVGKTNRLMIKQVHDKLGLTDMS